MYKHVVHKANESITTHQHGTLHCLLHSFPHIRQPISFIHCEWLNCYILSMTFIQGVSSLINVHVESFVVCTAGKMYMIVRKCCAVIPILFGWFHPYIGCSVNIFVTCSCCYFFRNGKPREERWEGSLRGRCMVCKIQKYRILVYIKNKVVNSNTFK